MPDTAWQQSPLAKVLEEGRSPAQSTSSALRLAERIFGYLNLRANGPSTLSERMENLLGLRLPFEPNTLTENSQTTALWLGPDEWLLVVPFGTEQSVARTLLLAGRDQFFAVADVSHGYTTVNISGWRATDTLSKGCSLDLHLSVLQNNCCAQTLLAKAGVVIRRGNDPHSFDLIVRRSFAEYLVLWLQDAGAEYGIEVL